MTVATAQAVQYLNLAYFGRPADPASLSAWPASGQTLSQIVLRFTATSEYATNTVAPNSVVNANGGRTFNDTNLINTFYQRLFGRLATSSEVAGWADALARGAVNYDYLGITILQAGLNLPAGTEMRSVLIAKFDSAQLYTGILFNNPVSAAAYSTAAAIQDGIAYNLATTTTTPQTFAQATAAVATMVANSGAGGGQTFTLTTNADVVSGNVSVINGVTANAGAGSTLQVFDTINVTPTNGVATANINLAGTAMAMSAANAPVFNGVTNFVFTNEVGVNTFAANQIAPNATSIAYSVVAGQGAATTNVIGGAGANLNTFTLSGADFAGSNFTVNFAAGTRTGTTDAVTFNTVNNVTAAGGGASTVAFAGAAGGQGADIVNLNAVGTNVLTALTSQDNAATTLRTLNVAGTGSVTVLGALGFTGTTSTINASTNTGGFDLTVGGNTATSVTGGTGNDTLRFNAAGELTAADSINLGTGTNTLVLADAAFGAAGNGLNALINAVTTAQIIGISANGGNYDLSGITQNQFQLFAGTNATFTNIAAADSLTVTGVNAGTLNAQGALGFNTLNLNLNSDTFSVVAALGNSNFTNQATINIATNRLGATNTVNTIGAITNSANANITITGNAGITITSISAAASVNASALVRPLTITTTNAGASSVTGGSGNDVITTGTAADTLIGGAGTDTLNVNSTTNGASIVGGLGADTINFSDRGAAGTTTSTLASTAAESFATAGQFDIITFANAAGAGNNRTVTTATGVNGASVAAATTVTIGTTVVPAFSYLVVNAGGGLGAATQNSVAYQDTNGNGIIDSTDWSTAFSQAGGSNDTLAYSVVGGQLQVALVGV